MIPRLVLVVELEAAPVLRVESCSAEDEQALLAWVEELDLAAVGAVAAERVAELRGQERAA